MEKKNQVKVYGKTTLFYLWDKDVEMFFKGVAVCNEKDTFDVEIGEKLARAKAVYKMRLFKANALSDLLADIEEAKALEAEAKTEYEYWRDKAQESAELVNELQKKF
jgi:hypothetical protein